MSKFTKNDKARIQSTQSKKTSGKTEKKSFTSRVQSTVDSRAENPLDFTVSESSVRKMQSLIAKENNGRIPKKSVVSSLQSDLAKRRKQASG